MKAKAKQMAAQYSIKYSLVSFQQYCNRDIIAKNALLFTHQQKLQANNRNRCSSLKKRSKGHFLKRQVSNPTGRKCSLRNVECKKTKQPRTKTQRSEILNITPAVIHNTASQRLRTMLNQRDKSWLKQSKNSRIFICKTQSFDWRSEDSEFLLRNSGSSFSPTLRPRTAEGMSGLNKIRVYLPGLTRKTKDEQINGWQSPFEDEAP